MKKTITLFACILFVMPVFPVLSQDDTLKMEEELQYLEEGNKPEVMMSDTGIIIEEKSGKNMVKVTEKEIIVVEEGKDTTRIKIGGKGIEIIEGKDGTTRIDVKNLEKEVVKESNSESKGKPKFKGNWAGIELGLNNFVNSDFSSSLDPSNNFMDLNTNRSINFNLNFIQYDIGLGTDKIGLVTGMGMEFSNYFFDGNNNIYKDANGIIAEYIPAFLSEPGASIIKSKLATTYLTVPLLLEFQIPAGKKRIHLSGGIIGGAKLWSSTKIVYKERSNRQKEKVRDDFNLASLRYGYTIRAGYRNLNLFANYYPVPLFEKNKGPELYPYSIGIRLIGF
jgi:hypothetical protein